MNEFTSYLQSTGFYQLSLGNLVMIVVGGLFST